MISRHMRREERRDHVAWLLSVGLGVDMLLLVALGFFLGRLSVILFP